MPMDQDGTTWEPETGDGEFQLHKGERLQPYMYRVSKEELEVLLDDQVGKPGYQIRQLDGKTENGVEIRCWCFIQLQV